MTQDRAEGEERHSVRARVGELVGAWVVHGVGDSGAYRATRMVRVHDDRREYVGDSTRGGATGM